MTRDWLQSALEAAGIQSARLLPLWRFMWIVSIVVFVLVVAAALWAVARHRRDAAPPPSERGMTRAILGATALTIATLFAFLVLDFSTGRAITRVPHNPLVIRLTGHQWWWEVEYDDSIPQRHLRTANEIHVPVGRPVLFQLESGDVIHSFWVPSLAGKKDQIPGKENSVWFQADTAGIYRGQCAEFCGYQHAKMALLVIAVPPDSFSKWYDSQLQPAAPPADSIAARGQSVFVSSACVMCHTIEGTQAGSNVGPPLTHIASRRTIAAGTLENTRGNLAGWIVDPQRIKPGANMPPNGLSSADLNALLTYLEGLR
ncbi:MAG TPA: cytochrome c oxidase subunit II [Gemmatimonadales bacterium]|jgi:cytochrome c oxidase subunit 2|nr:cytochrome c oxidase subunit II [Gemmatimonadales bacterium]